MRHIYENEGQHLFDFVLRGFLFFLKNAFRALIYSPFLIAAYLVSELFLNRNDHALLWLTMILIFSFALFILFTYLKKVMARLREKGNIYWIPVFILCLAFSCLLPAWIVYGPVKNIIAKLTGAHYIPAIAMIISLSFGYFVYTRHQFFR